MLRRRITERCQEHSDTPESILRYVFSTNGFLEISQLVSFLCRAGVEYWGRASASSHDLVALIPFLRVYFYWLIYLLGQQSMILFVARMRRCGARRKNSQIHFGPTFRTARDRHNGYRTGTRFLCTRRRGAWRGGTMGCTGVAGYSAFDLSELEISTIFLCHFCRF